MIFNKKHKLLLLDPNSDVEIIEDKINIILSPSLYWVKRVTLPVKSIREAKKLLPSIFEDMLPVGNYSYSAYKGSNESEFFIFAYEDKKILDILSDKNISVANVENLYFAQSELLHVDGAMKINDIESVYIKDGILVLVPSSWVQNSDELDLDSVTLSNHKISLEQYSHILDTRTLYKIGAVLTLLIVLVLSELFITSNKSVSILESKDEIFAKNSLKPTMLQNRAMLKNYTAIHSRQTKIRELSSYLFALKLKQNEKMTLLRLKNKTLSANFSGTNKGSFSHITSGLKTKKLKFTTKHKNGVLQLEIEV